MRIDLHVHTSASDGLLTPTELAGAVRAGGVEIFSVCDHDTVDGLAAATRAADAAGLTSVPGVEISAFWGAVEFHILGYFIDPTHAALRSFLGATREARHARLRAMLTRLHAMGIGVPPEDVLARAHNGNVGRPHLARTLVERGYVGSVDEAFDRYLGTNRPAYVPRPDVRVRDAIAVIRAAGGIASLAHPGLHQRDEAIPELTAAGLEAIEVYHPHHAVGVARRYRRVAQRHNLLVTGGSDFHGSGEGDHGGAVGVPCLPEADYERLRAAARARGAILPG